MTLAAFWPGAADIDWKAIGTWTATVSGALTPVALLWMSGRQKRAEFREKASDNQRDREDKERARLISERDRAEAETDRYRKLLRDEERAHTATRENRDEGWDRARGADEGWHDMRHWAANLVQAVNGRMEIWKSHENDPGLADMVRRYLAAWQPIPDPPRVPSLSNVERRPPDQYRYQPRQEPDA